MDLKNQPLVVAKIIQIQYISFSNILLRAASSFESFFEEWLVRQEHYLDELLSAECRIDETRDCNLRNLVSRVLLHYQQYYEEKSRVAQRDVFSPTWFTSLERALLWIAGFKPGLAFRFVRESVSDLNDDQRGRMARLVEETRAEERALDDKLAKIHESVAAPPLVGVARVHARDGEESVGDEEGVARLKGALEGVVAAANYLRTTVATKLVEMMSGAQAVSFLVAVGQFQLKIRRWGLERDARRARDGKRW